MLNDGNGDNEDDEKRIRDSTLTMWTREYIDAMRYSLKHTQTPLTAWPQTAVRFVRNFTPKGRRGEDLCALSYKLRPVRKRCYCSPPSLQPTVVPARLSLD